MGRAESHLSLRLRQTRQAVNLLALSSAAGLVVVMLVNVGAIVFCPDGAMLGREGNEDRNSVIPSPSTSVYEMEIKFPAEFADEPWK